MIFIVNLLKQDDEKLLIFEENILHLTEKYIDNC
ncbi:hypothetical protein NIES2098_55920 [Calothrix sp. NIES-2098]|nr:hypothetical protein NIES2098_55920 [Calothrix sp. NIES-2098]